MIRTRSLSIVFVVMALLLSAWGNVIAAAFCPRFSLNRDCCLSRGVQQAKQVKHESSCHHEMGGMKMDDMVMETASSNGAPASCGRTAGILACADAPDGPPDSRVQITTESLSAQSALDLPAGQCAHCQLHSQTTSETVSVVAIDPAKRVVETASLPADFATGLTGAFTDLALPSGHGPPGASSPRHVIINVFRI